MRINSLSNCLNFNGRIIMRSVKNGKTDEQVFYTDKVQDEKVKLLVEKSCPMVLSSPQKIDLDYINEFNALISEITGQQVKETGRKFLRTPQNNVQYVDTGNYKKEVHYSFYI